jgi:hypothetical protein
MLMLMKCNALKEAKHLRCYTLSKLGLQTPNTTDPPSVWCLDLQPNNPPITVGPKRVGTHDKRVTSLLAPISKYVFGIKSL